MKKRKSTSAPKSDRVIPPRVPDKVLNQYTLGRNQDEAAEIAEYVEGQFTKDKEHVTFLEKVQTEHVLGNHYDRWNVRTDKEQYWVITSPTNLYSQELFPSLDYTLTFHIGLMARVTSKQKGARDERQGDRFAAAFRRWDQAAEALDASEESEEIQAVGMRCRECLLVFIQNTARQDMVAEGTEPPKKADFVHWSEIIADKIAAGSSKQELRGYLKAIARSTWQLGALAYTRDQCGSVRRHCSSMLPMPGIERFRRCCLRS